MKTHLYIVAFFAIFSSLTSNVQAQSENPVNRPWTMGVNLGAYIYQGDLTPSVAGSWKTARPGLELSLTKQVTGHMTLKYALVLASLIGDDTRYKNEQEYRGYRQFYYKSHFAELSVSDNFSLFGADKPEKRFNPYVSAGVGVAFMLYKSNSWAKTEWSYFSATNLRDHVKEDSVTGIPKAFVSVPLGLGFNYRLNDRLHLNVEGLYRLSTSDYLDGYSRAGNNSKNDYFYSITAGLHFTIGKRKASYKETVKALPPEPVIPAIQSNPVAEPVADLFPDTDRDGIADSVDHCPHEKGTMEYYGCPAIPSRQREKADTPVAKAAPVFPRFTVYFAYDRASIDGAGFESLNEVIRLLKADTALHVTFKGHTDMKGSVEANYKLSMERSRICADYLSSYGISRNRLHLEAYSKLQPAADPADERLQWKNRRVEVVIGRNGL